jgi:hypothetical protein
MGIGGLFKKVLLKFYIESIGRWRFMQRPNPCLGLVQKGEK